MTVRFGIVGVGWWARRYRNARVFCLQSGHDSRAYENPNFREVVRRGIVWLSGRLQG